VKCLPSKHEALSSSPNTGKKIVKFMYKYVLFGQFLEELPDKTAKQKEVSLWILSTQDSS
jgi:hypothetical protein